jgi:hypothetical protein
MKKINLLFIGLMLFANFLSFAQSKDEITLNSAIANLQSQLLNPTEDGLSKIAHEKLSYAHSDGKIENKQQFMHALISGESDFTKIEFTNIKKNIVGKTALVTHILEASTHNKGKEPSQIKLNVFLVFIKDKSEWKLLGRSSLRLPL